MSPSIALANGALILVADARKALFMINVGDTDFPSLKVERTLEPRSDPRAIDHGAYFAGRGSAPGQIDRHEANEDAFADRVVQALQTFRDIRQLVVIAPPRFLARMRQRIAVRADGRNISEIAQDCTHLAVKEIAKKFVN